MESELERRVIVENNRREMRVQKEMVQAKFREMDELAKKVSE